MVEEWESRDSEYLVLDHLYVSIGLAWFRSSLGALSRRRNKRFLFLSNQDFFFFAFDSFY